MTNSDTFIDSWFPCSITTEDCYVPATSAALIEGLRGVDDESLAMTITLWAMDAADQRCVN